ncbi:MAG: hypothetical protein M3Y18_06680 [Candidatus Eremiobacteraeota bacterium]|nr:hypothetical protein [Candidatus Eremiobacteraeota bacterium]
MSVSVLAPDGAGAAEAAKPPAVGAPVMTLSKGSIRSGYAFAVRVSGSYESRLPTPLAKRWLKAVRPPTALSH